MTPTGTKTFLYMHRHAGKARMLTLGTYPAMSVADAHAAAAIASQQHARGLDPAAKPRWAST